MTGKIDFCGMPGPGKATVAIKVLRCGCELKGAHPGAECKTPQVFDHGVVAEGYFVDGVPAADLNELEQGATDDATDDG